MSLKMPSWETLQDMPLAARTAYTTSTLVLQDHKSKSGNMEHAVRTVVVAVMDPVTGKIFVGVSRCSPQDQYDSKLGREIASGRALKLWRKFNRKTPKNCPQQKIEVQETGQQFRVVASSYDDIALYINVILSAK